MIRQAHLSIKGNSSENEKLTPTAVSGLWVCSVSNIILKNWQLRSFLKKKHRSCFIFLENMWHQALIFVYKNALWLPFWRHLVPKLDLRQLKEMGFCFTRKGHTLAKPQNISAPFILFPHIREQISVFWVSIFNLTDCYFPHQCSQWGWYGCSYWASVAVTMGPYILSLAPSPTITKNGPIFVCLLHPPPTLPK